MDDLVAIKDELVSYDVLSTLDGLIKLTVCLIFKHNDKPVIRWDLEWQFHPKLLGCC